MFFKASLDQLYREDQRPWLVGFSGGKDSTMLASLIFDVVLSIPAEQLPRPVYRLLSAIFAALSTVYRMPSTVFSIPAIAEMIEGALDRMRKCSQQHGLNIDANPLTLLITESFWVNNVGLGYAPPQ
jgi:DNA sulfur modification protein DndC